MTRDEVCLRAAELVDSDKEHYSCDALRFATQQQTSAAEYSHLFSPNFERFCEAWGSQWGTNARECRVLALLFYRAMILSGDA
jgi:TorA maturation chaperone TorD